MHFTLRVWRQKSADAPGKLVQYDAPDVSPDMWEQYREGFPLRKDFPLRGRFSRAEQLRQALAANPEARYSMEELSIADAFEDLPTDMQKMST